MNDYNGYQTVYQPNWYYQPQQTTAQPMYGQYRNWPQSVTQAPMQQNPQPRSGSMIWVQGEAGARAYSDIQPGVPVALWDSEDQVIYIKSIDNTGKPSMTIIDYKERTQDDAKTEAPKIEYATKEQVDSMKDQFQSITEKLDSLGVYATKEQFNQLSGHLDDLSGQIEEIENRITSFGKPQGQQNSNRRGNK